MRLHVYIFWNTYARARGVLHMMYLACLRLFAAWSVNSSCHLITQCCHGSNIKRRISKSEFPRVQIRIIPMETMKRPNSHAVGNLIKLPLYAIKSITCVDGLLRVATSIWKINKQLLRLAFSVYARNLNIRTKYIHTKRSSNEVRKLSTNLYDIHHCWVYSE